MTDKTTSEVLNLAADYLQQYGWTGGGGWFAKSGEPACVEGAMKLANGGRRHGAASQALNDYVGTYAWGWNDQPERTAAEVIEVLRATAVVEATRESAAVEVSA